MISRLDYHPPLTGFTHTVVPLFERGLLLERTVPFKRREDLDHFIEGLRKAGLPA
jgi:hypothetical protein